MCSDSSKALYSPLGAQVKLDIRIEAFNVFDRVMLAAQDPDCVS